MLKTILSKNQISFLKEFSNFPFLRDNFYLSGGTALAGFYLNHRYSEDLDFFSEKEFDIFSINVFFKKIQKKLNFKKIDYQQSFNRNLYFLHFKEEVLKVEFTFFPFLRIEKSREEMGIKIDSLLDITVNKLFTIYQRSVARDYIDLYCILQREKEWSIQKLIKKAKIKFDWHIDPLQLATQFIKVGKAGDYPKMIQKISQVDLKTFFINEAKKLKDQIVG